MAKPKYHDRGYYETNPDAIESGPGVPPTLAFSCKTPLFEQITREAEFVGLRYYLHPKLGNAYRYKYRWKGEPWWIDVTLDRQAMQVWKGDGQSFTETAEDATAQTAS
jgi:hypothetical protein